MISKVIYMEKIVEQTLLFDFYGELLTAHQRTIYEDVILNDLSYSEIAEERGISRQGVHDLIKRCNKILAGYEAKLHLVAKFLVIKEKVELIRSSTKDPELIRKISDEILVTEYNNAVKIIMELLTLNE